MTSSSKKTGNRLRIIGGDWRSRVLQFPDITDIRPTPDRVRETLFNWLQYEITGASCLDLFAGSGILGLEALSRGASSVIAVEQNREAADAIKRNAQVLQTTSLQIQNTDAMQWLEHSMVQPVDIVFMDPPFAANLHTACANLLSSRGWLKPSALVYIEAAGSLASLALPASLRLLKEKRAGGVHYGLCEFVE